MKTLMNIMEDMSALYDQVDQGKCELKKASELANISGKYLKAYQLDLAKEIFMTGRPSGVKSIAQDVVMLHDIRN